MSKDFCYRKKEKNTIIAKTTWRMNNKPMSNGNRVRSDQDYRETS